MKNKFISRLLGTLAIVMLGSVALFSINLIKNDGHITIIDNRQTHTTISKPPPKPALEVPAPLQQHQTKRTVKPPVVTEDTSIDMPLDSLQGIIGEAEFNCQEARSSYECRTLARRLAERDLAEKSRKVIISVGGMVTQDGQLRIPDNDTTIGYSRAVLKNIQVLFKGMNASGYYVVKLRGDVVPF